MNENKKIFTLIKDLPNCPSGRKFLPNIVGDYFLSMTNDEYIEGKIKSYKFTKEEIESNPDWFSLEYKQSLNISNGSKRCIQLKRDDLQIDKINLPIDKITLYDFKSSVMDRNDIRKAEQIIFIDGNLIKELKIRTPISLKKYINKKNSK